MYIPQRGVIDTANRSPKLERLPREADADALACPSQILGLDVVPYVHLWMNIPVLATSEISAVRPSVRLECTRPSESI